MCPHNVFHRKPTEIDRGRADTLPECDRAHNCYAQGKCLAACGARFVVFSLSRCLTLLRVASRSEPWGATEGPRFFSLSCVVRSGRHPPQLKIRRPPCGSRRLELDPVTFQPSNYPIYLFPFASFLLSSFPTTSLSNSSLSSFPSFQTTY